MTQDSKIRQVSDDERALINMPTISSCFPLTFKSGVTYSEIKAQCIKCGQNIEDSHYHGQILDISENMKEIKAIGFCVPCNLYSPSNYRLYNDGRIVGVRDGKWVTYHMQREKLHWIKRLFKLFFW